MAIDFISTLVIPSLIEILKQLSIKDEEKSKIENAIKSALEKTCTTFPGVDHYFSRLFTEKKELLDVLVDISIEQNKQAENNFTTYVVNDFNYVSNFEGLSDFSPDLRKFLQNNSPESIIAFLIQESKEKMRNAILSSGTKLLMNRLMNELTEVKNKFEEITKPPIAGESHLKIQEQTASNLEDYKKMIPEHYIAPNCHDEKEDRGPLHSYANDWLNNPERKLLVLCQA